MANDLAGLDEAVAQFQGPAKQPAAPAANDASGLDDAIASVQGQKRTETAAGVRNALQFATGAGADEEAGYRHLARFTGLPLDTVRNRPEAARTAASLQ